MRLSDIVEGAYAASIGNRLVLVSELAMAASAYSFMAGEPLGVWAPLEIAGAAVYGANMGGIWTAKSYLRTKKRIERRGELTRNHAHSVFQKTEKYRTVGYCQSQGMYLAARKTGKLNEYRRYRTEHSNNILPNF